jgi:DNA uptake protein ComE-like DNA-binding protein
MPYRIRLFLSAALLAAAGLALAAQGTTPAPKPAGPAMSAAPSPADLKKMVDLNNASRKALCKLPGIDAKLADKIIKGRPYMSKAWLVSNNVVSMAVFQGIRGQVYVGPVKPAKK